MHPEGGNAGKYEQQHHNVSTFPFLNTSRASQIIYQPNFCRMIGLALMDPPIMMHMASHRTAEFTTSLQTREEVASYMMST